MSTDPAFASATLDPFRFDGKVVFITGAGGAFGSVTAPAFAARGARVFCTDIDGEALDRTVEAVRKAGGTADGIVADSGDPADVEHAFEALDAVYGQVDVVLNLSGANRGIGRPETADVRTWEENLRVNLSSKLLTAQQAARRMIAAGRGGSIVSVSSIAGSSVLGRESLAYGVAMAGAEQLTRELAVAWAPHGIRVNAIKPCQFVNSGLQAIIDDPTKRDVVARIISGIPLGRMGRPEEIVGPLVFLASDAASMVTGISMPVDGGNLAFNAGGSAATP
jgi:NAD(P)-dependent dehydrogenase (short-subunit alcohol dehydrogenase family)